MPRRTEAAVPPPLRGRSGGGANIQRIHMWHAQELQTRDNSRKLRKNMTDAEKQLWKILRAKQLEGFKFRRQTPIDTYITDFVCLEQRLVIELDGGQHANTAMYDAKRTRYLESQGFRILRFWNNDVLQNPEGVVKTILRQLQYPPTQPSPARGEGFKENHAQKD